MTVPILQRLNNRLSFIFENAQPLEIKNPHSKTYDRQYAEDCLFHTIGPLTNSPRWVHGPWRSHGGYPQPPGYVPGGPAPTWTTEEVAFAMAGDPKLLGRAGARDNPRSPQFGTNGGSPLWRTARKVAKAYRLEDPSELYANGFVSLSRLMQPGYDESRSAFISWALPTIRYAMENGLGGTEQGIHARGGKSKTGVSGLGALLDATTPEEAEAIANQVGENFRQTRSHEKHKDSPFGPYSSSVYQLATQYANALRSGDQHAIEATRASIQSMIDQIDSDQDQYILGASTGIGQAISRLDRSQNQNIDIKVGSIDKENQDGTGTIAGNIPDGGDDYDASISQEAVYHCLEIALEHDLDEIVATDPKLMAFAQSFGFKPGDKMGALSVMELRCLIRTLGHICRNYPGKGKMRTNLAIPRDTPTRPTQPDKAWCLPFEDPEIEPIPAGGIWHSIWARNGYQDTTVGEICKEITEELREFGQLGIKSARKYDPNKIAISAAAISKVCSAAKGKFGIILYLQQHALGFDPGVQNIIGSGGGKAPKAAKTKTEVPEEVQESFIRTLRQHNFPLLEDYAPIDRRIILEALRFIIHKLDKANLAEEHQPLLRPKPAAKIKWTVR